MSRLDNDLCAGVNCAECCGCETYDKGYQKCRADERERIVGELGKIEEHCLEMLDWQGQSAIEKAIEIVRGGEND